MEEQYTLNDLSAKEVKGIGERRWMRANMKWFIYFGLIFVVMLVAAILAGDKPVAQGLAMGIPGALLIGLVLRWSYISTKAGETFYRTKVGSTFYSVKR